MKLEEVPVHKIDMGKSRDVARKLNYDDKNLDDLVYSISKMGLLQPVAVCHKEDGNYELISGLRRLLAVQKLGHNTINSQIIDLPQTDLDAKMYFLTENLVRKDVGIACSDYEDYGIVALIPDPDVIDAIIEAFRKYGSIKAISEQTGLSEALIKKYVKSNAFVKKLQEVVMVEEGNDLKMSSVLIAADLLTCNVGKIEEEEKKKLLEFAREYQSLNDQERKQFLEVAKFDRNRPVQEMIKEVKEPGKKITVDFQTGAIDASELAGEVKEFENIIEAMKSTLKVGKENGPKEAKVRVKVNSLNSSIIAAT